MSLKHPKGATALPDRAARTDMDIRIFAEPQLGATYDEQLAVAKAVERLGFGGFFRADHLMREGSFTRQAGPTDVWVTLAALARETTRIRLGSLMSCSTFRNPAHLAIIVAQIDAMGDGRIELGLGAGSFPGEHDTARRYLDANVATLGYEIVDPDAAASIAEVLLTTNADLAESHQIALLPHRPGFVSGH
ncbi:MAG: hypothetical protein QOF25_4695 [Mycobacterium sp.]|nr:hypothetical protein [Mycobacterium sp.]